MAVSTTNAVSGPYNANGATTVFPFSFTAPSATEVAVATRDTDGADTTINPSLYAVTINGSGGGSVTFDTAPASGLKVLIYLDPSFTQEIEFENGSAWLAEPVNEGYDRAALRDQALKRDIDRAIKVPIGESAGILLPTAEERAGQYLAFDADGDPVPSSGTGGDSALRTDLAASPGSSLVGFSQSGAGAVSRAAQAKLRDVVSVKDFGAVGDGTTDDTDAIQSAVDACAGQNGRTLYFPAGNYYVSAPIEIPNYTHIKGAGPQKSRINLEGKAYTSHIFTNADPTTWGWLTIENFGFRAGSSALYNNSASQESWVLENVTFEIQTIAGITSEVSFQVNFLKNCTFYYCVGAVRIASGFCNFNNFIGCDFAGLAQQALLATSASCEVNNFTGCRFEAGGVAGRATFELATANNTNFTGCYFENTHPRIINQSGGGGASFDECHFTTAIGGAAYEFNSTPAIRFGTNTWGSAYSAGNPKMWVTGANGGKLGKNNSLYVAQSRQNQELVGPSTALGVGSTDVDTVKFTRQFTASTLADASCLKGTLEVIVFETLSGGFTGCVAVTIPVFAFIVGSGAYDISFGSTVTDKDTTTGSVTVTPSVTGGDTVRLTVAGVPGTLSSAFVTWRWSGFAGAVPNYYPVSADFS